MTSFGKILIINKNANKVMEKKAKSAMRPRYANEQYAKLKSLINLNEEDDKSFDEYLQDALENSQESEDAQEKKDPEAALKKFLAIMGTTPTLNKDVKKIQQ